MNKIKIINLPEITAADNTTYIPVSTGTTNATRKISAANLAGFDNVSYMPQSKSSAEMTQARNNIGAAPVNSPTFTGKVYVPSPNGDDASFQAARQGTLDDRVPHPTSSTANKYLRSSDDGTAFWDDINNLNGTQYVMVYGVGTPEENAVELQAAYDAAKNMPRYLGILSSSTPIQMYKGQTFGIFTGSYLYYKILVDGTYNPFSLPINLQISESEAKSTRTTIIVAPGEYYFGQSVSFNINTSGIDIKSLTGKKDVLINKVNLSSDFVYVSGINCGTGKFNVSSNLPEIVLENCKGGDSSFVGSGTASGTFIDCIGGPNSFVNYGGAASGTFINCTAGSGSFGAYGTLTGVLINCKLTYGTFKTPTGEGKIYNCIDGNGALVNYPEVYAIKNNPTFTGITSGIRKNVSVKNTSVTLGLSDDIVIPSGAGTALTLPSAIGIKGKEYTIKNGLISSFKASMTCAGYGSAFVTSSSVEGLNITSGDAIQIVGDSNVYSIISTSGSSINVSSSVSFPSGSEFYIYHKLRTTDNQTIDGYPPIPLTSDWEKLTVVSDGVGWLIV